MTLYPICVSEDIYSTVLSFVNTLNSKATASESAGCSYPPEVTISHSTPADDDLHGWAERFADWYFFSKSQPAVYAACDLCASKPETIVTPDEIAAAAGIPTVQGQFSACTRALRTRWGRDAHWALSWKLRDGRTVYFATHAFAKAWAAAKKADEGVV